jgi:hypothetical protein
MLTFLFSSGNQLRTKFVIYRQVLRHQALTLGFCWKRVQILLLGVLHDELEGLFYALGQLRQPGAFCCFARCKHGVHLS